MASSRKVPAEAAAYINAAMENNDIQAFLFVLRDVADAQGGIGSLTQGTELNRESLTRPYLKRENPDLAGLSPFSKCLDCA